MWEFPQGVIKIEVPTQLIKTRHYPYLTTKFQAHLVCTMNTIIKKVKSLRSLKNVESKELNIQPSLLCDYVAVPRAMQNLQPPMVLVKRQHHWMNMGGNLKTNNIYTAKQQMLIVDVLEDLIDVMLEEGCVEELEVC